MLQRTTLEQAMDAKEAVHKSRGTLEQNIEKPVEKEKALEETAGRLAKLVVLFTTTKHSAVKELSQEQQIQDHLRRVTLLEKRDAQNVYDNLRSQLTAELWDGDELHKTNDALQQVFNDLRVKESLLDRINEILDRKDEERYPALQRLIGELLVDLRDLLYHVKLVKKYLDNDEQCLNDEIKAFVNQRRV